MATWPSFTASKVPQKNTYRKTQAMAAGVGCCEEGMVCGLTISSIPSLFLLLPKGTKMVPYKGPICTMHGTPGSSH